MTTEQPYFVVKVTRCGECPHLASDVCVLAMSDWPYPTRGHDAADENRNGITPSCPMWPQRVEPPKD